MTSEPRFFIDHGMIHDRVTGKHVTTDGEPPFEDSLEQVLELLNSLGVAQASWQPIETAHNNGTDKVLLWWKSGGVGIGWWHHDDLFKERKWGHKALEYGWMCEGDACIPVNQEDCTHWMPLPGAPSVPSAHRGGE